MNSNNSILLIDPDFDPATSSTCNLLVKVGFDSFSYAIINQKTQQVNAVFDEQECTNVAQQFADRLKTDSYLKLNYKTVKVAVCTPNVIAIPNALYDENTLAAHTQFFSEDHTPNLYTHIQEHFNFTTVFAIADEMENPISEHLADGKKYTQNAGLLTLAEKLTGTHCILDFSVGYFSALYIKDQQVIYQNHYQIESVDEFKYYLLLMINQLGINLTATTLHLSGIIHEGDGKYNCLSEYFNKIEFITIHPYLDQEVLDDMPAHYYSSLLALDQCV